MCGSTSRAGAGVINLRKWGAHYRCMGCGHEWIDWCGPATCPECPHEYIKWLNYKEMFERVG